MNLLCVIVMSFSLCIFIILSPGTALEEMGFVCGHNLVFLLKLLQFLTSHLCILFWPWF